MDKKFSTKTIYTLCLLLLILRISNIFADQLYLEWNDRWYYTAVAESLIDYKSFENRVFETPQPVLSNQVGIIFMFSILLAIFENFQAIYLASSILSILLWLSACYPIYKLSVTYRIDPVLTGFLFLGLLILQEYFHYVSQGLTEGYFYPLCIWFYYSFEKAYTYHTDRKWIIVFFLLSLVLILFRAQAYLIFLSLLLLLAFRKDWSYLAKFAGIIGAAVLLFFLITIPFIETIDDGAESRVLSAIFNLSIKDILKLLPVLSGFLFNFNAENFLNPYMFWVFTLPSWIALGILVYRHRSQVIENKLILFSVLLVIISLTVFFISGWPRVNVRYIYYSLPFYFLIVTWLGTIESNTYLRYGIYAFLAVVLLLNFRIFMMYNVTKSYTGYEESREQVESFKRLQEYTRQYQPEHIYMESQVRGNYRLLYGATGQPVTADIHTEFEPGSFILLSDGEKELFDIDEFKKLDTISYVGTYYLFYKPP